MNWFKTSQSKEELPRDEDGYTEISFKVCGDARYSIIELLQHCETVGGYGHSFPIVIDPDDSEYKNTIGFDGDGSDRIKDIKVQGKPVTEKYYDPKEEAETE